MAAAEVREAVERHPEVEAAYTVAGEASAMLHVRARDTAHLEESLERLRDHPGVTRTQTQIVLSTLFERPFEEPPVGLHVLYILDRYDRECHPVASSCTLAAAASLPLVAPRAAWGQVAPPIVKPLPPEWFVNHGTNAELRWETARGARLPDPERALLRPQPHADAGDRRRAPGGCTSTARGVRRPLTLSLPRPRAAAVARRRLGRRVRRQRPQLLRQPAGHAGERHAVEAGRDRRRALARRAARPRCSTAPACGAAPSTCSPKGSTTRT